MAASKASRVRSRSQAGAACDSLRQLVRMSPSQMPKTAPSRSESRAARPLGKGIGPTAVVPPRSRTRATVSSALSTAKYGVQATAICSEVATAPTPATGSPSAVATENCSPSSAGRNCQPITAP
ncbi:hypothetical protein SALBM135S_03214 [Streptomyces alboniger]